MMSRYRCGLTFFRSVGFCDQYEPPCGNAGMRTYETPNWATPDRLSAEVFRYIT